ncbi:nitrate- and nitrite sensing domain-containing protein [Streptomyces sp. NPDC029526]|uniref:sensor histidine kinase n=1 Tax=Streptomyces sp. NPDC029526 TaxID=3155728 RepID=UPI0033D1FA8C
MRFRGKSIRRKIVALLLVPLLSLTTIWAFATVLTGREASRLFDVSSVMEEVGYPVEDTVRVLQQERRQTLVHLADPRASDGLAALRRSRAATDRAVSNVRANAAKAEVREAMGEDTENLSAVLDSFDGIESLRRSVEDGTVDRSQALDLYNRLVDPCYVLLANLHVVEDVSLDKQYRALVNLARARELLSREDALLGSALVVGRLSRTEVRAVSDLVAQRTLLYDASLPQLPTEERDRYESFWQNASSAPLRVGEEAAVASGTGPPRGVTAKSWDTAAGTVLEELGSLNDQATDRYQDRVRPVAMGVITQAVVAGVLGLLALLLSLFLSVRIGRGLVRDLRQLRLEAHEASGVRLPGVMRRLSAGEQIDVETEVPRLEYARNEIGEVGQALNTLHRAAVEAAVKQAELRAGVSQVFVNLARRSQVLLHKQLTLLDTMERRTEDADELADLFRLDHLTTRMRRHAEGLVILSGAAPSRQWRKPVQLMDIVRAAVAEVEDYERIEVRRLPRVAVTGPAVTDLTHLVAELMENATVFSPPHTAVQVLGERVANGFTLEIHDRGLGMTAEALLDANLRLAETPEFELSDTDRLGLFVVSRLAQRQNVRVSLQPSPYGGTTAVVFIPDALLTDDVPDTNGVGFRLDRPQRPKDARDGRDARDDEGVRSRRAALSQRPVALPGLPAGLLDGPVELEAPVGPEAAGTLDPLDDFPGALDDEDGEHGGLFRPRRSPGRTGGERPGGRQEPRPEHPGDIEIPEDTEDHHRVSAPVPLMRRTSPKLVRSHGRPVGDQRARRDRASDGGPVPSSRPEGDGLPSLAERRRGDTAGPASGRPCPEPAPATPLPSRRRTARPAIGTRAEGPRETAASGPGPGDTARSGTGRSGTGPSDTARSGTGPSDTGPGGTGPGDAEPSPLAPLPARRRGDSPRAATGDSGRERDARKGDTPPRTPPGRDDGAGTPPGLPRRTRGTGARPGNPRRAAPETRPQPGDEAPADPTGSGTPRAPEAPASPGGHGTPSETAAPGTASPRDGAQPGRASPRDTGSPGGVLPRRVRQASLAPQLKREAERSAGNTGNAGNTAPLAERDADDVRSRMASLQRGWQRGRAENAADGQDHGGTAPDATTEGDGR